MAWLGCVSFHDCPYSFVTNSDQSIFNIGVSFCVDFRTIIQPCSNPQNRKRIKNSLIRISDTDKNCTDKVWYILKCMYKRKRSLKLLQWRATSTLFYSINYLFWCHCQRSFKLHCFQTLEYASSHYSTIFLIPSVLVWYLLGWGYAQIVGEGIIYPRTWALAAPQTPPPNPPTPKTKGDTIAFF